MNKTTPVSFSDFRGSSCADKLYLCPAHLEALEALPPQEGQRLIINRGATMAERCAHCAAEED